MFRPKSEAVQVGVQKVLIPCRNGTNFGENRQLYFDIPRNIGFFQNAECSVTEVNLWRSM